METISECNELTSKLKSVINRIERKFLKGNLTENEKKFAKKLVDEINEFNKGYIPEYKVNKSVISIKETNESVIMDMLDEIGVGYYLLLNIESPIEFISILSILEKELSLVVFEKNKIVYKDEIIYIKYDDNLKSIGSFLGNCILVNKQKVKESNECVTKTIIHELVHLVLNFSGIQNIFNKKYLKDLNELLCETISMNNDKYNFVDIGGFSE
ncbi:MAG: hypothetical protein ACRCX8_21090 [Sarcina sp.]